MRFLIVQPWISYRGAETVSVKLCGALNKLGHPSKIACLFLDEGRLPEGSRRVEFILPSRFWQILFRKFKLALFILGTPVLFILVLKNVKNFDVLNPHNPPSLWVCVVSARLFGKKVVWSVHNLFDWRFLNGLDEFLVRKTNAIVTPTKMLAKEVKSRYGLKAKVIYNAI
ncbi:hypothetical protein A2715_02560 [Candidatus Woesebacteria bacterium RIFCSPHIGHO2_01_FULL_39_32]|uniref:Glycosyltransferase subfamily 4-like N-terminal domain-containing protein n=2 Tax=Candidatus Woeseibacteriota TaxID=1752722 RepID=A0A0G0SQC5_9BACT|nr:MAG: hypothetical protein UT61_C0065G0006 [Candidatus Woesebacteria bacterium GW2011_GWA1_39_8]OGM24035.1 MAG: hypothetical protein A2715_02560 [Candidatus Woesebacteria bacterium RIFCSPHIGHO2_01_FULL_39_32]OGM38034.1 MAG: hypothetical protein A3F01_05870 [Candidatus Woesebacteria bacterium RIFCSPHIGHO2_12_FULL_38_11]OGM64378.1 MAG: hypothetical protein A2893_00735 [Candidatus Woesebacteria bacterium RIFCSPLOWO2_01_FULL_39_25]